MKGCKKIMLISIIIFSIIIIFLLSFKTFCFTSHITNGISEIRKVNIGGIDQYILIRGKNIRNPILLYLHGGPGSTELIPFRLFHEKLEKYFTIVIWEQRGTGKSYSPNISNESMTINQFISDAHELTEYLKSEFNKNKILIVGHSWGSALGLFLVQKYPELFFAYIGSGQEVVPRESEVLGYQYLLEKAKDNRIAMNELKKLNILDPYLTIDNKGNWFEKIKIQRKWLIALGGEIYNHSDYSLLFNFNTMTAPEYTWMDFINFGRGSVFSLKAMWPQVMQLDLIQQIPQLSIPVYFLQGRHDYNTSSILVEKYFNNLKAPIKKLVWFEKSGHHPMYEESEKYDNYFIDNILPLCK